MNRLPGLDTLIEPGCKTIAVSASVLRAETFTCSGVSKAIATATDATTVTDEEFSGCTWELSLAAGKSYVISFVGENDQFIAVLVANTGSVFPIIDGVSKINLGKISINSNRAKTAVDMLCYLDTDDDDAFDCEDDTPCGGDACDQYYSCEFFGLKDKNKDKVCDEWEDGGDSFTSTVIKSCNTIRCISHPAMAVGVDGVVNVVWSSSVTNAMIGSNTGYTITGQRVFYSKSKDGGASFSTPLKLESNSSWDGGPAVAAGAAGVVYVVWGDHNDFVSLARSTDGGNSFSGPVTVAGCHLRKTAASARSEIPTVLRGWTWTMTAILPPVGVKRWSLAVLYSPLKSFFLLA